MSRGEPDDPTSASRADGSADAPTTSHMDAETRARHAEQQLAATEQLGGLGSYDWDMITGQLTWSDALFRIYGHDPGEFPPSYDRFMERVHPDDRARIRQVHERAVRELAPFETEERIVRADGDVRILLTNGKVLSDESGRPVRLRGVCRDVTEERTARENARRAASRFETLIQSSPDAIVVVDATGGITSVNPQAERFFGYTASEMTRMSVDDLVPDPTRGRHAQLRAGYAEHPTVRPMSAGTDLHARRADGRLVPVDIALSPLDREDAGVVAAFVRDATQRRQAEIDARRVAEAQMRRRQALELNDNVVQGLVALLWELEDESVPEPARRAAERTLTAARTIMSDLLEDLPDEPGSLVRTSPSHAPPVAEPTSPLPADEVPRATDGTLRVVIADDADDLRLLLQLRLKRLPGIEVVGEANDGQAAVQLCEQHRPDLVLLDLSMPQLDGLQAAGLIRERRTAGRIFVLSGYPAAAMEQRALAAGADAYFEKRGNLGEVCDAVAGLHQPA